MKTFHKTLRYSLMAVALAGLFSVFTTAVEAQVFNPPTALEQLYPANVGDIEHSSAYNFDTLYMSGFDGPWGGIVTIQHLNNATFTPTNQMILNYPVGDRDLETGVLHGDVGFSGAPYTILVSYHRAGVGHQVDFYDYWPNTFTVTYNSTQVLSGWPTYTRISMDCHIQYACAVTWEENDIKVATWLGGPPIAVGPTWTMMGTMGMMAPDVAFTHDSILAVNVVYFDPAGALVTEYHDYWILQPGAGGLIPFFFWDNNGIPPGTFANPNIDGWDHGTLNWAYTYTYDNANIYVRYKNGGAYITSIVNDGSIAPILPINASQNVNPTIACGPQMWNPPFGFGNSVMVVWHTDWAPESYVGVETDVVGGAYVNAMDYFRIPNLPGPYPVSPFAALDKMTEFGPRLYTVWNQHNSCGANDIKHRYHDWPSAGAYKTSDPHQDDHMMMDAHGSSHETFAYPNPFTNDLTLDLPAEWNDAQISVTITDIKGSVVGQITSTGSQINTDIDRLVIDLEAGSYMLNIGVDGSEQAETLNIQKVK